MRGTKSLSKRASRVQPYVKGLAENEYARESFRKGIESLREGAQALADQRQRPKRRWPKRLAAVGVAGAAVAAAMSSRGSKGTEEGEK